MKKYAVIPAKDELSIGSTYTVELPNNKFMIIEAQIDVGSYTDQSSQAHTVINPQIAKLIELDPWEQSNTDEVNSLWDAVSGAGDEFIKIDEDMELIGVRYDTLSAIKLTENRHYNIWTDVTTKEITFTNLDVTNTNYAVNQMESNKLSAPAGFKYVEFNTTPGATEIGLLRGLARDHDLTTKYFDSTLSDWIIIV